MPMDLTAFTRILTEIRLQPAWRGRADREMDYRDGNQLNSEILQAQRAVGIPPAIEPLIGPTLDAVLGMEVKTRTDWRIESDTQGGDDVAAAMSFKLLQAERKAEVDKAVSEAYAAEIGVGLGWVEVSRESDPFKYPYRVESIHRNEIWWDFLSKKSNLEDARYLVRRKWVDRTQAELLFPDKADLIRHSGSGWSGIDMYSLTMDGGTSTALSMSWEIERGWSVEEQEWRDITNSRVCLFEVWYREWMSVLVLKSPDGRVVEYDPDNAVHVFAIESGTIVPQSAIVPKMRIAWFVGPHMLSDEPSPYRHRHFPYVPFWGKREDRTNVPYGLIRGMMFLQDEVNARISKMQWGLGAVRTVRTEGAVVQDDEEFRQQVARPDADIILSATHMAMPGAKFEVARDFQLNEQQFRRLVDAREGIKRTGGVSDAFMGKDSQFKSGVAITGLVEQSTQALADINDNARAARCQVGDLLTSLIVEDTLGKPEEVEIPGSHVKDARTITLNAPAQDEESGIGYLDNDVQRTMLKVVLNDVPSSPSFRAQQLAAMSETFKSMPPQYQAIAFPHLLSLMEVPDKKELINAIKQASEAPTPEQIQQQIDDAVKQALANAKADQIPAQIALLQAQARLADATATNKGVEGMFSATQAASNIAMQPAVAPLADAMLLSAGFKDANGAPIIPNAQGVPALPPAHNTDPLTPANPGIGIDAGIEGGHPQ